METYETYEILQRTRVAVRAGRLASYWPANFHPYPLGRVRLGLVQTQAQWVWDGSVLDGPVVVIEGQTPVWRTEVQDGWLMAQALWRLGVTDKERLELLQALPGALIAAACAAGRSRDDIIDQMGAGRRTRPRPTWESLEQWTRCSMLTMARCARGMGLHGAALLAHVTGLPVERCAAALDGLPSEWDVPSDEFVAGTPRQQHWTSPEPHPIGWSLLDSRDRVYEAAWKLHVAGDWAPNLG